MRYIKNTKLKESLFSITNQEPLENVEKNSLLEKFLSPNSIERKNYDDYSKHDALGFINWKYRFEFLLGELFVNIVKYFDVLQLIEENIYSKRYREISLAPFTFKHARKPFSMWHAERSLHRILTYIDAYRLYIINKGFFDTEEAIQVNIRMIRILEMYLAYLQYMVNDHSFTEMSANNISRARINIQAIRSSNFLDFTTAITDSD